MEDIEESCNEKQVTRILEYVQQTEQRKIDETNPYWFIRDDLIADYEYWTPKNSQSERGHERHKDAGNIFNHSEDAREVANFMRVYIKMHKFADGSGLYYLYYSVLEDRIVIDKCTPTYKHTAPLRFSSLERARACIIAVGEDDIKRYYFGV